MADQATAQEVVELLNAEHGIEVTEVDFKEFERRKVPRMNSYASFLKYVESVSSKPTLIKI